MYEEAKRRLTRLGGGRSREDIELEKEQEEFTFKPKISSTKKLTKKGTGEVKRGS